MEKPEIGSRYLTFLDVPDIMGRKLPAKGINIVMHEDISSFLIEEILLFPKHLGRRHLGRIYVVDKFWVYAPSVLDKNDLIVHIPFSCMIDYNVYNVDYLVKKAIADLEE